jgi:pimeloyl-ACP methyl ester carboxylesterase
MTLNGLQLLRKTVPFIITAFCSLPWFLIQTEDFGGGPISYSVVLGAALIVPLLYVILKLREPYWNREMDQYVRAQIKDSLITLIPSDINTTSEEREQLVNSEIYKELTGVFWEAVDQSDVLRAHKQHFYSNGLEYSTAIDVFILLRFFAFSYAIGSVIARDISLFLVSLFLISLALIARWFAIPRARHHHLQLSAEQLDLLKREKGDFVADRFRQIVLGWRRTATFQRPTVRKQPNRPQRLALWDVLAVLVLLIVAAIGISQGWFGLSFRGKPEVKSSYIPDSVHGNPIVVVFVHGVFGTKDDTWLNPGSGASFPELLANDPELKGKLDVFAFEYFTPRFGAAPSIADLADQLRGALDDHRIFEDHKQTVFLAHSMGGIIVRQFILNNPDRMSKVPMIFFYATPTNGSDLASIAKFASANPQFRGMVPLESNDLLQSIQSMWLNSDKAKTIASYCGVEELPTLGVMVVPRSSATSLCNRGLDPFSTDHINIVKPTDRSDPRYTRFVSALRKEVPSVYLLH